MSIVVGVNVSAVIFGYAMDGFRSFSKRKSKRGCNAADTIEDSSGQGRPPSQFPAEPSQHRFKSTPHCGKLRDSRET